MLEALDEILLRRAADGDVSAFEVIYDRHSASAYAHARRICGDRALAEEVMQDAFLAVWQGAASFDRSRGSARGWLFAIVRHRAFDALRRERSRRRLRVDADAPGDQLEAADRTDGEVLRRELGHAVRAAVRDLPPAQRNVIVLAHFGDLRILRSPLSSAIRWDGRGSHAPGA